MTDIPSDVLTAMIATVEAVRLRMERAKRAR
jgi:hypothetical protein